MQRSMSWTAVAVVVVTITIPTPIAAQHPSPYLPLDHWAMPWVEHLIATGAMRDPDPLSRPLRREAVRRGLAAIDTVAAGSAVARIVRDLQGALPADSADTRYLVGAGLGVTSGTDSRREPLRPAGRGHLSPTASLWLEGRFGPAVLVSHSFIERRLRDDPDYTGVIGKTRRISGRFANSYGSIETAPLELTVGRLSREWGPVGQHGLFLSSEPYSYDHVFLRLGGRGGRIEVVYARLDDGLSPADSAVIRRYWSAMRAVFRPWRGVAVAIVQGVVWRGAGESFSLMWVNPLQFAALTREDEPLPDSANVMIGGQFEIRLGGGQTIAGELLIDDFSTQAVTAAPARMGGTLTTGTPLSRTMRIEASYTFVSSLAYRSHQGTDFAILRNGIGLARNFDDYDQASLVFSTALPAIQSLLRAEVTVLRQGEGDIRTPFALPSSAPFLHIGVVERTLRLALGANARLGDHATLAGNAGLHFIRDAAHVAGANDTRFVGRASVIWYFDRALDLP